MKDDAKEDASRDSGWKIWKFHLREWDDDQDQRWWFASTAVPLLAATIGPLANVLSIAALVTSWRMCVVAGASDAHQCAYNSDSSSLLPELQGQDFDDPPWILNLNIVSLVAGFVGNFFLLCNFTNRIRYTIALPTTIVCWYAATGLLIGATAGMEGYHSPVRPQQTYTQGFWYAVIAACMYMICAMLLMINMLGYFLGRYPPEFNLTESQRTLIIQTMLFFVWLAGGAAIFNRIETTYGENDDFAWSYVNSLYFCDVTILTVGFGDLYPTSNVGRGIVFPYSIGGIVMLGLVVSSIAKFAKELGSENVVRRHRERIRQRTNARVVEPPIAMQSLEKGRRPISAPFNATDTSRPSTSKTGDDTESVPVRTPRRMQKLSTLERVGSWAHPQRRSIRRPKLLLIREEKDRFDAMRRIQTRTHRFKSWYRLFLSVIAFGILWCVGATVFWQAEMNTRQMTYFQALYFCYISLLTIGYGDLSPISNAGRPFFVFWSLLSVPTMTILINDLGDTVIEKFKSSASEVANFTVLPQRGVWKAVVDRHSWMHDWLQRRQKKRDSENQGLPVGPEETETPPTIDDLAEEENLTVQDLAKRLTRVIRRTASDVKEKRNKRYSYEEWVEFTRLIRFTATSVEQEADDDGMIEWDWIGECSPMMADQSEAEFVLDRLCESMHRYVMRMDNNAANVDKGLTESSCGPSTENSHKGVAIDG